jgi:hypothetical protein
MEKSYAHTIANSFLGYFFDELESGLVIQSSSAAKDTARFIQVPSRVVASQATGLLKSEVKEVEEIQHENKDITEMFDRSVLQKVFGVVTAMMVAVSAYAYMV